MQSCLLNNVCNYNRELKQTDMAAANLQISIQKNPRPSEFSRPLTSVTLNLNENLPVDRRRVSLLKLPNNVQNQLLFFFTSKNVLNHIFRKAKIQWKY